MKKYRVVNNLIGNVLSSFFYDANGTLVFIETPYGTIHKTTRKGGSAGLGKTRWTATLANVEFGALTPEGAIEWLTAR